MKNIHNTINNIEFPAQDFERIKEFYGNVFNWTFTSYGEQYLEFSDGNMLGGFNKNLDKKANGPLVIIYSTNLEETETLIQKHGGKITLSTSSFPGGRRFHFQDIEGNELAVWSDK